MPADKEYIIDSATQKIKSKYNLAVLGYGDRVLEENFNPKKELRELQIKKEANVLAVETVKEILKEVL